MVSVRGVHRTYGSGRTAVHALRDVSFDVAPGELVALVGRSGSGKTTLLNVVGGLDRPDEGTVLVDGTEVTALDDGGLVRLRRDVLAFVFQTFGLVPVLSAAENVGVPLRLRATPVAERERRVELLLRLVGLADHADQRPEEMSGGQQQRVAIAAAVANAPRVLLADEPTGELDETTSGQVFEAIRHVNRELGTTTLIVTHDPSVAEHVRRTVQIRDGRTSTEVLRRSTVDEHGREQLVAEEFAVLDKVGRLQLPREFVEALELRDRVRLGLEPDHVSVWPDATEEDR
ncbi:ABC transporter ATP-binding protein [Actinotalea ferrariae]|uniref:ABC transporter ATP-binding protein n=1 Tax=Actinotalea ferrariae TaxID=1386098 RepID=UPI001C8C4E6E|nr:ABC transporter ATP-binding protein [Actinotalea ferrariae]MBX9244976.1 ABC transporter ATP-binding protein [Actinotalea ferrariae]